MSEETGQVFSESAVKRRVSQGSATSDECSDTPVVNTSLGKKGHARLGSSTRENILDISVDIGSQARFITSGMDNSDTEVRVGGIQNCECGVGNSCDICNVVEAAEPTNAQLMAVLSKAMDNLKCLQTDVKSSRQDIICMKARIHGLESSRASSRVGSILGSREDIAMSSQEEAEIAEGGTEDEGVQAQFVKLKKLTTSKGRKGRMEEEKDRGLVVVKQKLKDKEKLGSASQTEGETSAVSSILVWEIGGR